MWDKLRDFVDRVSGEAPSLETMGEEELRLAAAALLVRASVIDGEVDERELERVETLLQERYELDSGQTRRLIEEAKAREHDAVDLYGFTSVLAGRLDGDGRQNIVEMLWEVVMADGVVHEFESNLVWRVAELLGVPSRERIRLRKKVEARQTGGNTENE